MKLPRHITGFVFVTAALLLAVVLFQWTKGFLTGHAITMDAGFNRRQMIAGLVADSFRALLLVITYRRYAAKASSYPEAIWFGILTSLMAGTLWVIYQYGVKPTLGAAFLVEETIILLTQGIFSGLVLRKVYPPFGINSDVKN